MSIYYVQIKAVRPDIASTETGQVCSVKLGTKTLAPGNVGAAIQSLALNPTDPRLASGNGPQQLLVMTNQVTRISQPLSSIINNKVIPALQLNFCKGNPPTLMFSILLGNATLANSSRKTIPLNPSYLIEDVSITFQKITFYAWQKGGISANDTWDTTSQPPPSLPPVAPVPGSWEQSHFVLMIGITWQGGNQPVGHLGTHYLNT